MTDDEIKAAIAAEGSLTVGNWTYSAKDEIVNQFQKYVKDTYGADIKLNYVGSQQPSEYLTKLAADQKAGSKASYDVIAVEENYWSDASQQGLVDDVLDSDLIPNQSMVLDAFKHAPDVDRVPVDGLPGRRLRQERRGLPDEAHGSRRPAAQGQADPAQADRHHRRRAPARPRRRDGQGLQGSRADEGGRGLGGHRTSARTSSSTRPTRRRRSSCSSRARSTRSASGTASPASSTSAGTTDAALLVPPTIYPANGYLWVPKGAAHPVLAQIFMNWRLAKDVQFPNDWPIDHGQWSELSEGFLGPDYADQVPDWFKADYFTYFPTLDQIQSGFKTIDWEAYNASSKVFLDYYAQQLGA